MHSLIIGMTESGKTTLAKLLAHSYIAKGHKVAVLDPVHDPDWGKKAFVTNDVDELKAHLYSNRSVYVFVDESGAIFNEGNSLDNAWLATRSRHFGHSVHFLAQRAIQIPKTMRDQTSRLYLFTSSASDGKLHSEEWNQPELAKCNTLPRMHFYIADRFSAVRKAKIVDYKKVVACGKCE